MDRGEQEGAKIVKYCFCSAFYLTILGKKYAFWVKSMHLVKGMHFG